jgi:hypothetical protein
MPLAGAAGAAACALAPLFARRAVRLVAAAWLLAAAAGTAANARLWRDERRLFERAVAADPDYAEGHCLLCLRALQAGEPARGEAECAAALGVDLRRVRAFRDPVECRVNLGAARLRLGRPAEAVAPLREALRFAPDDPQARADLERALAATRR